LLDVLTKQAISEWGAFAIRSALMEGRIWEFITFQFLHASVGHVLFNMIGLYFFGPWMERWWGSRRFLVFYLLCGVGGAAFYTLLALVGVLPDAGGYLVGASAGIYGILVGVAIIAPQMRVALMFVIEMTMRRMAMLILGIAVLTVIFKWNNSGGEAGHLGGALVGYLLMSFPMLLSWAQGRDSEVNIIRPKAFSRRRTEAKIKPRTSVNLKSSTEVDAILDKMLEKGRESLTDEEREILKRASETHTHKP
jgi:membrane associated rhomboid family serine protease